MTKLDSTGKHYPYAVGVRHLHLTDKKLEASVYYPIDKSSDHPYTALWYENPTRTMKAMKEVFGPMFQLKWMPEFILRTFTRIVVPATTNATISSRFATG